ncbi:hypothetical protein LPJ73_004937, partial [Coemansia sp. RSA 2703]
MPPIDDAEILARYGLDSFANTVYGHGDDGASDIHGRGRSDKHGDMSQGRDGSSRGRRSRHGRGSYNGDGNGYTDVGDDDDEDDEDDDDDDDDDGRRFRDSMSANGAATHSLAISDRDPLHVYQSVAAVLENKGDVNALSDMAYRAKFSVSNKNFSPPMFMQVVHSDTSYGDL